MDCPRCSSQLERYSLGGKESVTCEGCGYIGVPVEHRGESRRPETWDDALERFRDRYGNEDEQLTPAFVPIEE